MFSGEQGVAIAADRDGRDGRATHLVAVEDGHVVGTCRLVFAGAVARLGRLAVERDARCRGVATAILKAADEAARKRGADRIELHAQTYALELYSRDGYEERGDPFIEEGIEHVAMEKRLA